MKKAATAKPVATKTAAPVAPVVPVVTPTVTTTTAAAATATGSIYAQNYLFYGYTVEAYVFKNLIEVLQNNLKDVCFVFTRDGIYLDAVDDLNQICVDLKMSAQKFEQWHCVRTVNVGINLQQLYKIIKSIKKKDVLTLYITHDKPTQLSIKKAPSSGAKNPDVSHLTIQSLQMMETSHPSDYTKPHCINTADFQKAIKEMAALSKTINIRGNETLLTLSFSIDGLYGKQVELDQEPTEEELLEGEIAYEFDEAYVSKTLSQFIKLSGLNGKMRVFAEGGSPLKLDIDVGSLGTLSVLIKSRSQMA
jgi:proliferating cell nuclear antigen